MATNEKPPDDPGGTPEEEANIITDEKLEEAVSKTVTGEESSGSKAEATMTLLWSVDGN